MWIGKMNKQIVEKINEIGSLEAAVREHINTTRYQNDLISDSDNWNQICSSLDTIGDTSCSISDYVEAEYPSKTGLKYIYTYGLLQALFIQQNAISHLSEAFGIKYQRSDKLKQIRLLRNAAIGHPTKQDRTPDGHTYYNYISRMTLSKQGFTLMQSYDQGKTKFLDIELYPIINDQLDEVRSAYETIANKLKEADKMHKEKFKGKLLADIFHSSMSYSFGKVAEGIHSPDRGKAAYGLSMLQFIQKTYSEFEAAFKERGDLDEYTKYDLDMYNHALSKLEAYLKGESVGLSEIDAKIYHFYIRENHNRFEQIAKEVDDSYLENGMSH